MTDIHREVLRKPLFFLAFGFGSGFSPKAPGTVATLVATGILGVQLFHQ